MNDNELVYLYCIENNEIAFNFLYKKYELKNHFFLRKVIKKIFCYSFGNKWSKINFLFSFFRNYF